MEVRRYLVALRRRWLLIVLAVAIGLAAAAALFALTPRVYSSSLTFYVSTKSGPTGGTDNGGFAAARVASYVGLLKSERIAQQVATETGLGLDQVLTHIEAGFEPDTVLINATASSEAPETANQMARALATVFPTAVDDLDNLGQSGAGVRVTVISGPTPSDGAVSPIAWRYALVGGGGGLIVGILLVLALEIANQSIRGGDEAEAVAQLPSLGLVPHDPDIDTAPLTLAADHRSQRAEAFRQLRASLERGSATSSARVLAISSAMSGEGRSVVTVGLGCAFAEKGDRVLIVDADLRRPRLAGLCGQPDAPGLAELLSADSRSAAAGEQAQPQRSTTVHQVEGSTLSVLSAGGPQDNPADLLSGDGMRRLLQEVRGEYDTIIVDTPPVLALADAVVVAGLCDVTVFVVHENSTRRTAVGEALRLLDGAQLRVAGLVLNGHRVSRAERLEFERSAGPA